ncbi:MAG: Ribosomal protein [Pseudomonadota bacterium]|jgi:ribosomal protein L31
MAKKSIHHPNYHDIIIVLPNGQEIRTKSTYNGDKIFADIDISKHPAWKKDDASSLAENSVNAVVNKFQQRFSKFSGN